MLGGEVAATATYDGRIDYFCSAACRNDFAEDPQAYLRRIPTAGTSNEVRVVLTVDWTHITSPDGIVLGKESVMSMLTKTAPPWR